MNIRLLLVLTVSLAGCRVFGSSPASVPAPSLPGRFEQTLSAALAEARRGRFDRGDSILADFALTYAGSPSSSETLYWRAMLALDSANADPRRPPPLPLLDHYLGAPTHGQHWGEAVVLRQLVATTDALRSALALDSAARLGIASLPGTPGAERDAEIRRLKEELQKTKEELERLKKRLAPPPTTGTPPPPPGVSRP